MKVQAPKVLNTCELHDMHVHNFLGAQFNILAYCWQVLIAIAGSLPNG
jgi:hypothetical protein